MQLTAKEEKIARLALDKGAQPGERESAAIKLINSLYARGVTVEDIEKIREKVVVLKVASPAPPPPIVPKAPNRASQTAYTAPEPAPPAKKNIPQWLDVTGLSTVAIILILAFAGTIEQISRLMQPARPSESAQVSPSPEPTVRRAQLVTPKETHAKRHPKD